MIYPPEDVTYVRQGATAVSIGWQFNPLSDAWAYVVVTPISGPNLPPPQTIQGAETTGPALFTGLVTGATYVFQVCSYGYDVDSGSLLGPFCADPLTATVSASSGGGGPPPPPPPKPPAKPSGVVARALTYDTAFVQWNTITDPNTAKIRVQRVLSATGAVQITHDIPKPNFNNPNQYDDQGVAPALVSGQSYFYTITAFNSGGQTAATNSNTITIPVQIMTFTLSASSVIGGNSLTGTVSLNTAAPAGGAIVALQSMDSHAVVASSVTIPAGVKVSSPFPIVTSAVTAPLQVVLNASYGGATVYQPLTIDPIKLATFQVPTSVVGGKNATATVTIDAPAPPGGLTVDFSSGDTALARIQASVVIVGGQSSASGILITTSGVTAIPPLPPPVIMTATYNGQTLQAQLQVIPGMPAPIEIESLKLYPTSVISGGPTRGTVTLSAAAPAQGMVVGLGSSNTQMATVASSFTVGGGETTGTFNVSTRPIPSTPEEPGSTYYVTITASVVKTVYAELTIKQE